MNTYGNSCKNGSYCIFESVFISITVLFNCLSSFGLKQHRCHCKVKRDLSFIDISRILWTLKMWWNLQAMEQVFWHFQSAFDVQSFGKNIGKIAEVKEKL